MKTIGPESMPRVEAMSAGSPVAHDGVSHLPSPVSAASYKETTQSYVERPAPDRPLLSFRYVRPWLASIPVLDLGCAMGAYLREFAPESVGVDVSKPNLEHCRQLGLQVVAADLNSDLPFASESFPAIFCSHVLEHVDAPIQLLRECWRILSARGTLVLGLPIEASLVNRVRGQRYFYHHPGHLYSFSLENIDILLQKTGYEIVRLFFEPRIVRFQPWLSMMQRLPGRAMYPVALAYWVVARKTVKPKFGAAPGCGGKLTSLKNMGTPH